MNMCMLKRNLDVLDKIRIDQRHDRLIDIEDNGQIQEMLDNGQISAEEAGFLQGYNDALMYEEEEEDP